MSPSVVDGVRAQVPTTEPLETTAFLLEWTASDTGEVPAGTVFLEGGDGRRTAVLGLDLPDECARFGDHEVFLNEHVIESSSISVFVAARRYCDRAAQLSRGTPGAEFDYVSAIDFGSLSLDEIPSVLHCSGIVSDTYWEFCETVRRRDPEVCLDGAFDGRLSWVRFHRVVDNENRTRLDCRPVQVDPATCRLTAGAFVGEIVVDDGADGRRATCRYDPGKGHFGIAIEDVRLRDVNADGYLDAVVAVSEADAGGALPSARSEFVLTRRGPAGPLEWVEESSPAVPMKVLIDRIREAFRQRVLDP